jgi:hypothetical protein
MATVYEKADESVIELVNDVIAAFHIDLFRARIGVLMREKAPASGGMVTLGKARKVSGEQKVLMPYDFVIWFAADWWEQLDYKQRRALIDHELTHCQMSGDGECFIRKHDFEEFNCIIERHGFWRPSRFRLSTNTQRAIQRGLGLDTGGGVVAMEPPQGDRDVLDQIDDLLDGE